MNNLQATLLLTALAIASLAAATAAVEVWVQAPGLSEGSLEVNCGNVTVLVHTSPADGSLIVRAIGRDAGVVARVLPCVMERLNLTQPATPQSPGPAQIGVAPVSAEDLGGEEPGEWTGGCLGSQCTTTTLTCTTARHTQPAATTATTSSGQELEEPVLAASGAEENDAYRLAAVALAGIVGGFAAALATRW